MCKRFASGHISLAGGPERAFSEVEWPLAADAILRAWRNKTFKAHEFFVRAKGELHQRVTIRAVRNESVL
jgi:hypothetical protein